jgi:nucleoside-diphosphate-sugar epimerase
MEHILIGGLGYVGKALWHYLNASGKQVSAFSSKTQLGNSFILDSRLEGSEVALQLMIEELGITHLILTFPPQGLSTEFLRVSAQKCRALLLGTTSVYSGNGRIEESSAVNSSHIRLPFETAFIGFGGQIMRLSGIYGPDRDPLNWIQMGKESRYTEQQLNLIHINNIVEFLLQWVLFPFSGDIMNLSDGQRHSWGDIYRLGELKGIQCRVLLPGFGPNGDRVIGNDFARTAYPSIQYVDFFEQFF